MDSAFNLLTSLYCSKYYEEQIVEKLRDIHSDWKVHYEELIVEEEKPKENDQEPKEEDLKAIDELLAKAEKIISQVSIGSSRSSLGTARRSTGLSTEPTKKPSQAKSDIKPARIESKLPSRPSLTNLSRPTTAAKPVYMNAPYRTDSIPNTFRRSKSVVSGFGDKSTPKQQISEIKTDSERRLTDLKSSSRSSIGEQRSTDSTTPKIQTVEKRIRFGEMAPTLCLPSRYSNLSAENSKLTESLNNELKSRKNAGRNSFIEKFNETCLPKTSVYENCLNFDRMTMMYKRASLFLDQYYLTIKSEQKPEQKTDDSKHQNLVSLFKLKIMAKKSNEFKQVFDELFSYEREKFKLNSKSNLDLKSPPVIDLLSLESMENNSLIMKKVPYEKVDDLKEFVEAKCDLIELRFNKILVNYLEKKFIDEILRNEKRFKEPDFAQYVNLIFAIILGKRTIIVK